MREILSQRGFSEEEITSLETREDYETVRLQVERMQADNQLDQLQARTESLVQTAQTLDEKWETFRTEISELDTDSPNQTDTPSDTPETVEAMRTRLEAEARTQVENTITEKVGSIPLIGTYLADWFISATQEIGKDNDSIGGKVKHWLVMLVAGWFGVKGAMNGLEGSINSARSAVTDIASIDTPNVPELEITQEHKDIAIYETGITAMLSLSEYENNNTRALLSQTQVKTDTYETILVTGYSVEGFVGDDIIALQNTLRSQEGFIDSILKETRPDWKTLPLFEIFKEIGKYGEMLSSFENMNIDDFLNGNLNIGALAITTEGFSGGLNTLFESLRNSPDSPLHGVREGLFVELLRNDQKKIHDNNITAQFAGNDFDSPEEQRFEETFIDFGRNFTNIIVSDFYLGKEEDKTRFENFFTSRSLTIKEVFEFYILTGGSKNPESYNDAAKTIIYTKVWHMLGEDTEVGNSLRADTYNTTIRGIISGEIVEGTENIPPQFINISKRLLDHGRNRIEGLINQSVDWVGEAWNTLEDSEKTMIVLGGGAALFVLMRTRIFRARVAGIGMGLQIAIVTGLIFMAQNAAADEGFQEKFPHITSQEQLLNMMIAQAQENGYDISGGVESLKNGDVPVGNMDISMIQAAPTPREVPETEPNPTPVPDQTGETSVPEWGTRDPGFSLMSPNTRDRIRQRNLDALTTDGMTMLTINEHSLGNLTIRRLGTNYSEWATGFYISGERKRIYYSGLFGETMANGHHNRDFFVKNSQNEVFLAVPESPGEFTYISIAQLEARISASRESEYLIKENTWGRDLYMDGYNS